MKTNKGFGSTIIILILSIIVVGGLYVYEKKASISQEKKVPPVSKKDTVIDCAGLNEQQCKTNPNCFAYTGSSSCVFNQNTNSMSCPEVTTTDMLFRCYQKNKKPISVPTTETNLNSVILGQEFTITQDEKVLIADSYGATFKLTGFYFYPCPAGTACIWSGLDVFYEFQLPSVKTSDGSFEQIAKSFIKDKPLQNPSGMPYSVTIKDSDYKTYAKIILKMKGQLQ